MKRKGAFYYQLHSLKKPLLVFYLIVIAASAVVIGMNWNGDEFAISGLEMASMICLFVIGCTSFRDDFLFLMQSGVGRQVIFQSHCLAYGLACLFMATADTLISGLLSLVSDLTGQTPYQSMASGLALQMNGPDNLGSTWILLLVLYLFLLSFGYLLGVLSYRGGRKVTVLLAIGVPVLFFGGLPVFLVGMGNSTGWPFLARIVQTLFGSYPSTLTTLFVLALLCHGIGGVLHSRAQVRRP